MPLPEVARKIRWNDQPALAKLDPARFRGVSAWPEMRVELGVVEKSIGKIKA